MMEPLNVVSNTSPLIFIEKIHSIDLLKECFHRIYIPEEVHKEWGVKVLPEFISTYPLSDTGKGYVQGAVGRLHKGELETIELAIELELKFILMDDLLARRFAQKKGLSPIGILGILKFAYKSNYLTIDELRNKIYELTTRHGLYVSSKVLKQYLDSL